MLSIVYPETVSKLSQNRLGESKKPLKIELKGSNSKFDVRYLSMNGNTMVVMVSKPVKKKFSEVVSKHAQWLMVNFAEIYALVLHLPIPDDFMPELDRNVEYQDSLLIDIFRRKKFAEYLCELDPDLKLIEEACLDCSNIYDYFANKTVWNGGSGKGVNSYIIDGVTDFLDEVWEAY